MNFPELYCYVNKLKIKQGSLEKSENDFVRCINMHFDGSIQKDYDDLKKLRERDCDDLGKDVQENLKSLKHIKTAIVEKNLENIDLEKLKNGMVFHENCTSLVKQRINEVLENLLNEEMALTIDITNFEMKLSDFNKQEYECTQISRYSAKYTSGHNVQEEVKEFAKFLNETGGQNGGWTNDDHLLFIKMFNKIKNTNRLIQSLQTLFPDMTKEKLVNHIDWYNEYLHLRNVQKNAIEKWRQNKTKNEYDSVKCNQDSEEKKPKSKKNLQNDNPVYTREKVEKWKLERQQQIEKDLEVQADHWNKTKEAEKQKLLLKQEVKKEVRKWKSAKEAKQKAEILAKEIISLRERERRVLLANKLIREFQTQDNILISKRLHQLKINVKSLNGKKKQESPRRNYKKVARNPDRIFKATRQWIARTTSEQFEENMFNKHLPLRKIPKLAVPIWRQIAPQN